MKRQATPEEIANFMVFEWTGPSPRPLIEAICAPERFLVGDDGKVCYVDPRDDFPRPLGVA